MIALLVSAGSGKVCRWRSPWPSPAACWRSCISNLTIRPTTMTRLKARDEVAFTEKQLASIRDLSTARLEAQTKVVERMVKLVAAGTDSEKDLAAFRAELAQTRIQGQKDNHEAETANKNAIRNRGT